MRAIKMRSKESNRSKSVQLLKPDLANGPLHCFGYHTSCTGDFYKAVCKISCPATSDNIPTDSDEDRDDAVKGMYTSP